MKESAPIRPLHEYETAIAEAVRLSGYDVNESAQKDALSYTSLLLEWNQVMNLTALTSPQDVAIRHFLDSWMLLPLIDELFPDTAGISLIDVGTGAGFPGLPLKIVKSDIKLVLLDSLKKRVGFLKEAAAAVRARNVQCVHARAEEAGRKKEYRDSFDIATARAVASLPELCEYCLPFVKPGGYFIAMKGDAKEEIKNAQKAVGLLGGKLKEIRDFQLPGTDMRRSLIIISKERTTPSVYPRKAGKPHISPLL